MKITWGALVTNGAGKIGGHVASHNKGGAYLRTKVKPKNPQTAYQVNQRYTLVSFSKGWAGLTAAQQAAWNAAVVNWTHKNNLAGTVTPTGKNLYSKLNIHLTTIGASTITTPPTPASLSEITGLAVAAATPTTLTVSWTSGAVPAGQTWAVWGISGVSAGRSFVKNRFRQFTTVAAAATSPANIFTAYNARFGAPVVGQKIFIKIVQIDIATGTPGIAVTTPGFIVT